MLVSSGAIAAGLAPLGLARRPQDLATQQAAASVGQGLLVAAYTQAFARHGLTVAQVLLTADDVVRRRHYVNAHRALDRLLGLGVLPVVNENDTVATHEIRFGDNDRLAALVAHLVAADALVLLSDVDALYDGPPARPGRPADPAGPRAGGPRRRPHRLGRHRRRRHGRHGHEGRGRGDRHRRRDPDPAHLGGPGAAGRWPGRTSAPGSRRRGARRASRLLWLAHAARTEGRLVLDDGAVAAVVGGTPRCCRPGSRTSRASSWPATPSSWSTRAAGWWHAGWSTSTPPSCPPLLGRSTRDLAREYGAEYEREVVHRDDLVVLDTPVEDTPKALTDVPLRDGRLQ